MKELCILGSTGSIGRNTLRIVDMFPDRFRVRALAAKTQVALLSEQIARFKPDIAVVFDEKRARELRRRIPAGAGVEILHGAEGYRAAADHAPVDTVVAAMVGAAGLMPALAAIDAGKNIALANKETLVIAGDIVMKKAAANKVQILPVDSEHSAVFQCLSGQRRQDLAKIHLTASGGPFFNKAKREFAAITPAEALKHPTWQMGQKISIDSATLMNKGLEVIEAQHLFGVPTGMIEVVVHPQSLIHSMVSFKDGSVIAQMGIPDMRGAIAYALSHPERLPLEQPIPDFAGIGMLKFKRLDLKKFPCLGLAFSAGRQGGTLPAVLNAANEAAVYAFLNRKISFIQIVTVIEEAMAQHSVVTDPALDDIIAADEWARRQAQAIIRRLKK
ncbi:MAG: 1-deoxy-D-xylulose-5-phosphate reductoisomerase [Desulfobacterales bacterium]|nr:1-deoxy-D-xylulose-5-phosphate reductoisomerase [Desulfobacterales bacterium]